NVADGAHETGIGTVARTFERGGDGSALARLDFGQRQCPRYLQEAGDFEFPVGAVHFGHAIVLDLVNLIVRRDPTREVLPVQHFAIWLHVEERHDGLVRARLVEAEDGERSSGERQRGKRHAAANDVTAGERRIHLHHFFSPPGFATPITPQAIRSPALPTRWLPSTTFPFP